RFVNQIVSFNRKFRMSRQSNPQKQISLFSATHPRFALTGEPDALTFVDTARNFDLICFDLIGIAPAQGNLAGRSMKRFFKCDHDAAFTILSAFLGCGPPAESSTKG